MTTQTNLTLEQLPYGREAALVSDLMTLPRKVVAQVGNFFATIGQAIELRNRYLELNGLDDAALIELGLERDAIPAFVAREGGLLATPAAPAANSNFDLAIRPAA
jgi:hypothetical protein